MSNELKIGKIITICGKREEWPLWSEKFKARANRKGYKGILVGSHDYIVPTDNEDIELETDKEKKRRMKCTLLRRSFEREIMFQKKDQWFMAYSIVKVAAFRHIEYFSTLAM